MTINVSESELVKFKEELGKMVELLMKKGLMPPLGNEEKNSLINNVTDTLHNDNTISINMSDLKNPQIQKSLSLACTAQLANQKNPGLEFNIGILFKSPSKLKPDELKNELKKLFKDILNHAPAFKNLLDENKFNDFIDNLANKLTEGKEDKSLAENNKALSLLSGLIDPLIEQRRSFYGVDTQKPGSVFIPVQSIQIGDEVGVQDLATYGDNYMADKGNTLGPDPMGLKAISAVLNLSDGSTSPEEAAKELVDDTSRPSPSPFNRSPSPFR